MYSSTAIAGPGPSSSRSPSLAASSYRPPSEQLKESIDIDASSDYDSYAEAGGEPEHLAGDGAPTDRTPLLSRGLREKQPLRWRGKLRRTLPKVRFRNPTLILENSGSVARDHLASERTFLAYLRTSLAIASTGVGLVQLFTLAAEQSPNLVRLARPVGGIVILIALFTLFYGTSRFFIVQGALIEGKYPVARVSPTMVAVCLGSVVILVFGVLMGTRNDV